MNVIALFACVLALMGIGDVLAGWLLVRRFARHGHARAVRRPPISVLKPLAGVEPELEEALASLCRQDYPVFQVVFGATDPTDPALDIARRVAARFPATDVTIVPGHAHPPADGSRSANRKVGNLITMLPAARHDLLVIADADVHAPAGYLEALAAALEAPSTGLVTTLYTGRPAVAGWPARFGASEITHSFLPAALLGRALGREDALGATLAVSRETLARAGGLAPLAAELADDAVLGRRVAALGLGVRLASTVPATTVSERTFGALFRHELRWARTIRGLAPVGFAFSALRYPLAFALAAIAFSGFAAWSLAVFAAAWAIRAAAARDIDRACGLAPCLPIWLIPMRDLFSLSVLLASYAGRRVEWRGLILSPGRPGGGSLSPAPEKGFPGR